MNTKLMALISILLIGLVVVPKSNNATANDIQLTIYTYESLLAYPEYDFVGAYANYSGIPRDNIQIVYKSDANTIITQAVLEKDDPQADVLIGIDNALIHIAKEHKILEPYSPPELTNISSDLISNLDPEHYVVPYDYGIIALWYDSTRINSSTVPTINNLTLDSILELDLHKNLIVQNPTLSSPGLGFLLWTIAVYGDPEQDIEGLLNSDWRDWWREASSDLRIASSWGSAYEIWTNEAENRPIMISYGSSPAYGACLFNDTGDIAVVTHEQQQRNAWLQIEGIGLVNNAPHKTEAQRFINWFLSKEVQDNVATSNWMYPASSQADIPECFAETAINPDSIDNILNSLIPTDILSENLNRWKDEWEEIIIQGTAGINFSAYLFVLAGIIITTTIIRPKSRKPSN